MSDDPYAWEREERRDAMHADPAYPEDRDPPGAYDDCLPTEDFWDGTTDDSNHPERTP